MERSWLSMSGMALWTHENQIRWANVTNFRIHLSGEMNVFRFNFRDLEMLPQCGFMERICALEKGRSYLKTFFHWLCDLNIFFNLLDSQFSHLQNGRYNIFFMWECCEKHRKCLLFILLSCEWEKLKWCVEKKKKRHGLQTMLRLWMQESLQWASLLPSFPLPLFPLCFSPFPLPYCLNCIFCMRGNFLFLSFH